MDSDFQQHQFQHHFQDLQRPIQPQKPQSNGLTRYRSAPSSYFTGFLDSIDAGCETEKGADYPRPLSPETENIFAKFISSVNESSADELRGVEDEFIGVVKQESEQVQQQNNYSSQVIYSSQSKPPLAAKKSNSPAPRSMPMAGGNGSALVRHSSLPAGFLDNINIEEGTDDRSFSNGGYLTGFPIGSWDDSSMMSDSFSNSERDGHTQNGFSELSSLPNQDGEMRNRTPLLSHHLSLPKNALEKLLQFQDSVPCKIRAKRGMATHPRSIAERVRRTRISERMRKLQDLVPCMDKQTNTADMLDLAVEYIKDLQKQVKTLTDNRAKCTCSS